MCVCVCVCVCVCKRPAVPPSFLASCRRRARSASAAGAATSLPREPTGASPRGLLTSALGTRGPAALRGAPPLLGGLLLLSSPSARNLLRVLEFKECCALSSGVVGCLLSMTVFDVLRLKVPQTL